MLNLLITITNFILKYISKFILFILGYKIDKKVYETINENKGYVWIYPHTSRIEGIVLILLNLILQNKKILFGIKSSLYDNVFLQPFLKKVGAIRIPMSNEIRNKSTVETICEILNKEENAGNIFGISPEGMTTPTEWRSGFFYIAKHTNRPIVIGGLDYFNHILTLKEDKFDISCIEKYEDFKEHIQDKFSKSEIYPLYPDCSYPRIIANDHYYTTSIDYIHFTNLLAGLICLLSVYDIPFFNISILILIFTSHMHHYHKESNDFYTWIDLICIRLALIYAIYNFYLKIVFNPITICLCSISAFTFFYPKKRSEQQFRKKEYIISHSLFHIFLSITFAYVINS